MTSHLLRPLMLKTHLLHSVQICILLVSVVSFPVRASGQPEMKVEGESLVLGRTAPSKLCFDKVKEGSLTMRSTFEPGGMAYTEGKDYVVDYANGTVARTADSSIPD